MENKSEKGGCPCDKLIGLLVVAVGVIFLLRNLGYVSFPAWNLIWPAIIIVAGLKRLVGCVCKCGSKHGEGKDESGGCCAPK